MGAIAVFGFVARMKPSEIRGGADFPQISRSLVIGPAFAQPGASSGLHLVSPVGALWMSTMLP
jgi:hypothetical protein